MNEVNTRLSQTMYRTAENLTSNGNPAAMVESSNLVLRIQLIHRQLIGEMGKCIQLP